MERLMCSKIGMILSNIALRVYTRRIIAMDSSFLMEGKANKGGV